VISPEWAKSLDGSDFNQASGKTGLRSLAGFEQSDKQIPEQPEADINGRP
jgi:hypothetical protein